MPEAWGPFAKSPAVHSVRERKPKSSRHPVSTFCRYPIPFYGYCGKPGEWDPDDGLTLCADHSEFQRKIRSQRQRTPEQIAETAELNGRIASMNAHPVGWRRRMYEKWYGDDAVDVDYNRSGK